MPTSADVGYELHIFISGMIDRCVSILSFPIVMIPLEAPIFIRPEYCNLLEENK